METLQPKGLKAILNDSIQNSMNYKEYRNLVTQLVGEKATTGAEQTETLIDYTILNYRRMKRWDKTLKVPEIVQEKLQHFKKNITWLVLTESWCGDAAHIVPVINKVAELNKNIDFKVVLRDENEALMNRFLTQGGKSIPKLIMIDNTSGEVLNTFGPRPSYATKLVNNYKAKYGKLTPEFKEELQHWYNKDKGQSTIEDLMLLFED